MSALSDLYAGLFFTSLPIPCTKHTLKIRVEQTVPFSPSLLLSLVHSPHTLSTLTIQTEAFLRLWAKWHRVFFKENFDSSFSGISMLYAITIYFNEQVRTQIKL